jgi:hypothetical protein
VGIRNPAMRSKPRTRANSLGMFFGFANLFQNFPRLGIRDLLIIYD